MATSVRSTGRKVRLNHNHQNRSGNFFQQLTRQLLDAEANSPENRALGDLLIPDLSIGIEVKAVDTSHSARIRESQKEMYDEPHFVRDWFAYAICCWNNKKRLLVGQKKIRNIESTSTYSPMARIKKKEDQVAYMAGKIREIYLLDIRVIDALAKQRKRRKKKNSFPGRQGESHIHLTREKDFWPLRDNFKSKLRRLRLNSQDWVLGSRCVELEMKFVDDESGAIWIHSARFNLHTVLSPELHDEFWSRQDKLLSNLSTQPSS